MRRMSNELLFIPAYAFKHTKSPIQIPECTCAIWLHNYCIHAIEKPLPIPSKVPGGPGDGHSSVNNVNVLEKRNGSNLPVLPDLYLVAL